MTVLLILTTFALFLGIDYMRKMKRTAETMEANAGSHETASLFSFVLAAAPRR